MVTLRARIVLVAAALAAFGASLAGPFYLDDFALFSDPAVRSPEGWLEVWRLEQTRPLTYFTFWLNAQAGGLRPFWWRVVSVGLHAGCALALYAALSKPLSRKAALIAAGLFAVHPIQTEAVAYVFARATLLATLFCLLSLGAWLSERRWTAVGWFALALAAKEECVAFPLVLALAGWNRKARAPVAAMLGLAGVAGTRVLYAIAVTPGAWAGPKAGVGWLDYLAAQGLAIPRYFRLLAVPWGFSFEPDLSPARGALPWLAWALILAAALAAWRRATPRSSGFWFVSGLILLAPSSSFLPAMELSADRRMYLPMAALAAAAGLLLERVKPAYLAGAGVLLAVLSIQRCMVWNSPERLWGEAVRAAPNRIRPRLQLARALDPERALALLEQTRRMAPDDPSVHAELGRVQLARGRADLALGEFGRALALEPSGAAAHNNRGLALLLLGQLEAAAGDFRRALELDPCHFEARLNLARLGLQAPPHSCRYTPEQRDELARTRR